MNGHQVRMNCKKKVPNHPSDTFLRKTSTLAQSNTGGGRPGWGLLINHQLFKERTIIRFNFYKVDAFGLG